MIFTLENVTERKWNLHRYQSSPVFIHERFERQPGEPTHAKWVYVQASKEQPLQFRLNLSGKAGSINKIRIQVDSYAEIVLPIELSAGDRIVCDGTVVLRLYDVNGKPKAIHRLQNAPPVTSQATHNIVFDCRFNEGESPKIEMQFRSLDKMTVVESKK